MSDATLIEPDLQFAKRLMEMGGESLKKCYQCGTCSVACELSPETNPFPRKEILWAQWGLKDRLAADPDIWLCHQCNDCSERCPRGAKPGDVMAAARQATIEKYSTPGFLARWLSDPKYLPALIIVPAILLLIAIIIRGGFSTVPIDNTDPHAAGIFAEAIVEGEMGQAYREIDFDHMFTHWSLVVFFNIFIGLAYLGLLVGVLRFWTALNANPMSGKQSGAIGESAIGAATEIATHQQFNKCVKTQKRRVGHLLVFYGFVGMFITTSVAFLLLLLGYGPPFGMLHPVKLLGNVSGLAFIAGWIVMFLERRSGEKTSPSSVYADWSFLYIIGLTVATGFLAQFLRFADTAFLAYTVYFIHLVLVFMLLVYLPYSKFAHIIYRTVAIIHARKTGRNAVPAPAPEIPAPAQEAPAAS